jgi:ketosteroid isomerase-like protein
MNMHDTRVELQRLVDAFLAAWISNDWSAIAPSIGSDAVLLSGQHGSATGPVEIAAALGIDAGLSPMCMRTSNHYVGALDDQAVASAYVLASRQGRAAQSLFGATVVFAFGKRDGVWLVSEVRLSVNWYRGDCREVRHWGVVPDNVGWKLGDPAPAIVSELDSPWARLPRSALARSSEDAVRELYSKYSFAIDQADISLLADCFASDVKGGFAPMGKLSGRHAVIGQLKSFRRHWPWMQHFADVPLVELDADGRRARMIVARIIPERQEDTVGERIYGAHYQIEAAIDLDGQWRIRWTDYRPGWFSLHNLPAFDIGNSEA